LLHLDAQIAHTPELGDGARSHIRWQRLAVPVLLVLDLAESLALDGAGDDYRRVLIAAARLGQCLVDLAQVVPVDENWPAAERLDTLAIHVEIPLVFGGAALAQPVDVEDGTKVAE